MSSYLKNFLFGGWKRWLVLGPIAAALLVVTTLFFQPLLVALWRFMPAFVLLVSCSSAFVYERFSWKGRSAVVIGQLLLAGGLLLSNGAVVVPLLLAVSGCTLLVFFRPVLGAVAALPVLSWLIIANAVPAVSEYELAQHIVRQMDELADFPVTGNDRNLPRSTAFEYAVRSNTDRTKKVGRVHIAWLQDGTPAGAAEANAGTRCVWQAPLNYNEEVVSNRIWNSFWGSVQGVTRISCSDTKMQADVSSGENAYFMFGADSWVTDLIFKIRHPLSSKARSVYWQKADGKWTILVSSITYRPSLTGTMIPVLGHVTEIGPHGQFNSYRPEKARQLFEGATLFPTELARTYGEAYRKFRFGLADYFWYQKGLLEISENQAIKDSYPHQNSQPHFQFFEKIGPQLVLAFEPEGKEAKALARVLLIDAVSGKIRGFSKKDGLIINGPRTALENLQEAAPSWNWTQYETVEPLLVHTADGRWYYQVTIVNKNHATVGIIVVDAVHLVPQAFDRVEEVQRYFKEGKR